MNKVLIYECHLPFLISFSRVVPTLPDVYTHYCSGMYIEKFSVHQIACVIVASARLSSWQAHFKAVINGSSLLCVLYYTNKHGIG